MVRKLMAQSEKRKNAINRRSTKRGRHWQDNDYFQRSLDATMGNSGEWNETIYLN